MLNKQKLSFTDRAYPWLIVLTPVICQYKLGPLDWDVVVFLAYFFYKILVRRSLYIVKVNKYIAGLILYIAGVATFNIVAGYKYSPTSDIILRSGRYCLYLFIVFFLGNESVTYENLMRAYRVVAYAATIYVIIQTAAYYATGIMLPNKLGVVSQAVSADEVGRFRSFYSEPSVLAYALTPFIACSLFHPSEQRKGKNSAFDALFVSFGIILSTSGQGIFSVAIVWVLWLFTKMMSSQIKGRDVLLIIIAAVAVVILYQTGVLEYALGRVDHTDEGSAIDARMSGYETLRLLSLWKLAFGTGFGNYIVENYYGLDVFYETVYYSSLAEFLFTQGIIGTSLWVLFFIKMFRRVSACGKVLLIAMGALSLSGSPMTGVFFPTWLTLVCLHLPEGEYAIAKTILKGENT